MTFKKPRRAVNRVFIHCSASDHANHDNVETMNDWHKARWPNKRNQDRNGKYVGYHFFISKDGVIHSARHIENQPIAQRGHNRGTIAICCHGLKRRNFTSAQMLSLKTLCEEINQAYGGAVTFHGHKEVAAKACPVFDYKAVSDLDKYGRMRGYKQLLPLSVSDMQGRQPLLRVGAIGPAVEDLQEFLNIKVDGHFGPKTKNAVKAFQKSNGLTPDGVVGVNTWAKLD